MRGFFRTSIKKKQVQQKRMDARSCTSTSSSCSFYGRKDSNRHHKAIEYACSTCLFCVSCPLSILWCCIKLPCRVGCTAAGQAKKRFTSCGPCGSVKKIYASYSSFSDMDDSYSLPSKVGNFRHKDSSRSSTSTSSMSVTRGRG